MTRRSHNENRVDNFENHKWQKDAPLMHWRKLKHDVGAAALRQGNRKMDYADARVGLTGLVQQLI